jgi:propanol-preferring alcohol dehydrogenase
MMAMMLRQPAPVKESPLNPGEVSVPAVGPGEILIRVRICGVCHTDVHIVEGDLPLRKSPIIPGHQVVGTVEQVGPGVDRFATGDRAGVAWLYAACGSCEQCRAGLENLCVQITFTGYDVHGGFAEYIVARADFAYRLPTAFDDLTAAPLLCAGIIGYRSLRLSEISPGGRLGLFGFGASAHLAIQVARHWGCEVFVFTRSDAHRALARELGAAWVGAAEDRPPAALDSAVVFAPSAQVVVAALGRLRRGGTVAINAVHLDRALSFDYERLYWERTVRSVSNSTRGDGEEFLALAAAIPIATRPVAYQLDDANQALQDLKEGKVTGAAVLTVP